MAAGQAYQEVCIRRKKLQSICVLPFGRLTQQLYSESQKILLEGEFLEIVNKLIDAGNSFVLKDISLSLTEEKLLRLAKGEK
jgi:hypothetical protein